MKPNCSRIIVSAFSLEEKVFAPYHAALLDSIKQTFQGLNVEEWVRCVPREQFADAVLGEKDAVGFCYAPVGVAESSAFNRTKGISAALVHNKYIAQMCRRVSEL